MSEKLTIYYDSSCGFCRQQVNIIRSEDSKGLLEFVAMDPAHLERTLYLKDSQGQRYDGVDAFAKIWCVTGHPFLSLLCRLPVFKQIAKIIYRLITKYRHYLNKSGESCDL